MSREREILQPYDDSLRNGRFKRGLLEMAKIDEALQKEVAEWTDECLSILRTKELGNEIIAQPMTRVSKINAPAKSHTFGEKVSLGYILPMVEKSDQHLVLFKSGKMITVAPDRGKENEALYKECLVGKGAEPLIITDPEPTETSVFELFNSGLFGTKVVDQNDAKGKIPLFESYISKALKVSIELKANKEAKKREKLDTERATVSTLRNKLHQIFPK